VAAALLEGRVGLSQFDAARLGPEGVVEPAIAGVLARTSVAVDPALTAGYPACWPARLQLELTDGRVVEGGADFPRGKPENPVPPAALAEKARDLIAPRYGAGFAERVVAAVEGLEREPDLATLMRELMATAGEG